MEKFGQKNLDVLQNIEFGIIEVYRADRLLLDVDVNDAINALVRRYRCEEEQRTPPTMNFGDRAQSLLVGPKFVRVASGPFSVPRRRPEARKAGLRSLNWSSVFGKFRRGPFPRWSRQGSRQGYLDFRRQVFALKVSLSIHVRREKGR